MRTLLRDIRYGLRMMVKNPLFTTATVLTLALGIGASTAIFSVVQTVLLSPLPLEDADRLVCFWITAPAKKMKEANLTPGLFAELRERNQTLEKLSAYETGSLAFTGWGEAEQLPAAAVTSDYFNALGLQAFQGRTFLPGEDIKGSNNVAVISFEFWQRRFGGGAVVGRTLNLDNVPTTVVGIMPPVTEFPNRAESQGFPSHIDVWVPLTINRENISYFNYQAVGRLKSGVGIDDAQKDINKLWGDFVRENEAQLGAGALGPDASIVMVPLKERIVGNVRLPLFVLMVAVGLLLLIACANIANLLLARATLRGREIALRRCIGASPFRIVRQLMTESLLLALAGGACGLLLATWGLFALKRFLAEQVPLVEKVGINFKMLLFAVVATVISGAIFGLAPALRGSRVNLQEAIKEGARGSATRSSRKLGDAFVISQIALSLILMISAALLIRSFKNLTSVDPGFRAQNVLSASLALPESRYPDDTRVRAFYSQLLERAQNLPGVDSAALCQIVPFSGGGGGYAFTVEGYQPKANEPARDSWRRSVSTDYFSTMGITVIRGRAFEKSDNETAPLVTIVDEKLARENWPDVDPIGKRIRIGGPNSKAPWLTVVGIVRSVKNRRLDEDAKFYIYQPFTQWVQRETSVVIRTNIPEPQALTARLRSEVSALDPELPLFDVETVEETVVRSVSTKRVSTLLLGGFAMTALLLAVIGIYGVMSLNVTNRTNEFGIRLALGARPIDVLRLVLKNGMLLALIGVVAGSAAAFGLTRLMTGLLFGVTPSDPITFAGVSFGLCVVALLACYIPARRATKVDPLVALRYE